MSSELGKIVFKSRHSGPVIRELLTRFAAGFDVITGAQTITDGTIDGRIVRGLVTQKLVTDTDPPTPTPHGLAWRAGYTGDVAPVSTVTANRKRPRQRKLTTLKTTPKPTPKPSTVARDLMAAGLVFVHPKLIDDLSTEELALWIKAKRHERDGLTLAALAALLGEPLAHVRIRAARIRARGYVVACRDDGDGETEDAA